MYDQYFSHPRAAFTPRGGAVRGCYLRGCSAVAYRALELDGINWENHSHHAVVTVQAQNPDCTVTISFTPHKTPNKRVGSRQRSHNVHVHKQPGMITTNQALAFASKQNTDLSMPYVHYELSAYPQCHMTRCSVSIACAMLVHALTCVCICALKCFVVYTNACRRQPEYCEHSGHHFACTWSIRLKSSKDARGRLVSGKQRLQSRPMNRLPLS